MAAPTPKEWPAEQAAAARAAWEAYEPLEACERVSGIPKGTVRRMAMREGWTRPELTDEQRAELRAAQTAAGRERQLERWAERRAREADEAGADAAQFRALALMAADANDDKMTRACAVAYGILIDKAQLLSGGTTGRIDLATPEQRAAHIVELQDDLAKRRGTQAA